MTKRIDNNKNFYINEPSPKQKPIKSVSIEANVHDKISYGTIEFIIENNKQQEISIENSFMLSPKALIYRINDEAELPLNKSVFKSIMVNKTGSGSYQLNINNLPPQSKLKVTVKYAEVLEQLADSLQFTFPALFAGNLYSNLQTPNAEESIQFRVKINNKHHYKELCCSSHELEIIDENPDFCTLSPKVQHQIAVSDFVMSIKLKNENQYNFDEPIVITSLNSEKNSELPKPTGELKQINFGKIYDDTGKNDDAYHSIIPNNENFVLELAIDGDKRSRVIIKDSILNSIASLVKDLSYKDVDRLQGMICISFSINNLGIPHSFKSLANVMNSSNVDLAIIEVLKNVYFPINTFQKETSTVCVFDFI